MTGQMHEQLILNGEQTSMAFCPPIPEDHPRIRKVEGRLIKCSACWRGYIGKWEIKGGRLYLLSVSGRYELQGSEPLFADWVTATLRVPCGERIKHIHMGFGSVYEDELHIRVEKGVVAQTRVLDNRNRDHDFCRMSLDNLPGGENRFPGDDEM